MDNPIKKYKTIHEQVYSLLKERIIKGEYNPNQRLFEAQLAREFSVSRSPVREAIRILEQEGLITQNEQSMLFVYSPSIEDVEQIYQCREVLESLAVSLCAEKAEKKELKEILDTAVISLQYVASSREEDMNRLIELNSLFHDLIIRSSQNKRLVKQLDDLRTLTFVYRRMNMNHFQRRKEIADQHINIAEVLIDRDSEQASLMMKNHIARDKHFLMTMFKEQIKNDDGI
ncbi:GntR family transcriptional regulator [Jeotgalibacillus sp. ET6]|uniref:GntR family transcriptional regulator n=1 Tax=Jeotgalibacillus sp. ET6 TaxID=3037260 RepID=UPI0024186328|nr:GntR family transcriptional regulator [Jeotgalibacillus sp. ET6]MDG5470732.1 GntR family transcriptional regulator [Jeotgalibacillus sp. ET6]